MESLLSWDLCEVPFFSSLFLTGESSCSHLDRRLSWRLLESDPIDCDAGTGVGCDAGIEGGCDDGKRSVRAELGAAVPSTRR
jgi:hypothetical protein